MTEKEKMLSGQIYNACDPELLIELNRCKDLLQEYKHLEPSDLNSRLSLLQNLLGSCDENVFINQPFYCDYGTNIHVGDYFYANTGLIVLDQCDVIIGDHAFLGPRVNIYCACHPIDAMVRNSGVELGKPVTIGDNVWIGGGSVVVNDIPDDSVAVGNPCKVIKKIYR